MELDRFTRAYIECALWASTDNSDDSGGEPLDANYTADDLAPSTLATMVEDCRDFQTANAALLDAAYETGGDYTYDPERAGHDFWLTRNRHGAGFWDRGLPGDLGKKLTDMSHPYGSSDLYVGDDGLIYC